MPVKLLRRHIFPSLPVFLSVYHTVWHLGIAIIADLQFQRSTRWQKCNSRRKTGIAFFHDKLISQPVEYNKKRGISIHSIKTLPPLERRPDGSLYRMTPAQRKQAASLIRRECCCCEDGNCIVLDDGDTCTCPQTVSFSVCCKWFRWAVLPLDGTLEAGIFRDKDLKRCAVCGAAFVPRSNRGKYCPDCAARVHRRQKTESERKRRSAVDS